MSVNWVMIPNDGSTPFIALPNESTIFASPSDRTTLKFHPLAGDDTPLSPELKSMDISSSSGRLYLTNQRVVYISSDNSSEIPNAADPRFTSLSIPLSNIPNSHTTQPWFGPNGWWAEIIPVPGGGLTPQNMLWDLTVTFKDGGAFEFFEKFQQLKENLAEGISHADVLPMYEAGGSGGPEVGNANAEFAPPGPDDLPPAYSET